MSAVRAGLLMTIGVMVLVSPALGNPDRQDENDVAFVLHIKGDPQPEDTFVVVYGTLGPAAAVSLTFCGRLDPIGGIQPNPSLEECQPNSTYSVTAAVPGTESGQTINYAFQRI